MSNVLNLLKKTDVIAIYLYGSMAKAKVDKFSDVDIGVLVGESIDHEQYFDIESKVAKEMENKFKGANL